MSIIYNAEYRKNVLSVSFFPRETNCHADLDDSKVVRATSVGPPGKSPYVYVFDVHANTAPRELVAMLRRYVYDWLHLSPHPPPTKPVAVFDYDICI
ncbi:uncharacterized protein LOC122528840 isoform X2 [Frieseomelitta varia]|uniref:uncharacterized protein LOC122528840 isoform X2 n=1 Tax=Frieseomelitta varia TaxID=561572 RepID=UPI001CB68236|nr:uncharacterized protein LOC122528840 isoform X2 [Frieseomelitta varia]